MKAIVGEEIIIHNYTQDAYNYFNEKLTFNNPEYFKKLNSGRWVGNTPQKISLMQRDGNNLIIPFGMLPDVFAKKSLFTEGLYHSFAPLHYFNYGSSMELYPYQENAVQAALKGKQGVIVAPCGAGKTQIGLELAARIGGRTLWLTHTTDLLNQSMNRAKANFNLSEKDYGTITGGKIDIGNVITFATVQTMSKIDLEKLKDKFDVIITDECHHVVGTPTQIMMFYKVISSLRARYKYGLTATPKRSDGLTPCMFALIGPKVFEVERKEVKSTTCRVDVVIRKTDYFPDMGKILNTDGTISYAKFINHITADEERNRAIVGDIAAADGTCLVLTDRIAHIDLLKDMLAERGIEAISLSASATKRAKMERANAISALNNKEVRVLIATYALAKEGLDVPTLNNLIMATPQKNETIITQSAGRVSRKSDTKEFGMIYDYEDCNFSMLSSWQRKRVSIYKKLGFNVNE